MLTATLQPTLRQFQPSDLDSLVNRDGTQIPKVVLLNQALAGLAFTATVGEWPIASAGMILPWPGVGMTWMIVSEEIGSYGVWLTRTVTAFLDEMKDRHQLHRIEAVALVDSPRNQAWLEVLGFHVEQHGVARQFLADQRSVIRYEWVKD